MVNTELTGRLRLTGSPELKIRACHTPEWAHAGTCQLHKYSQCHVQHTAVRNEARGLLEWFQRVVSVMSGRYFSVFVRYQNIAGLRLSCVHLFLLGG